MLVAEKLGIPLNSGFECEYKQRIVDYMFAEYKRGRTPNPDVLCNREIKFDVFLKIALELGQTTSRRSLLSKRRSGEGWDYLLPDISRVDNNKDQSYFVSAQPETIVQNTISDRELTKPSAYHCQSTRIGHCQQIHRVCAL